MQPVHSIPGKAFFFLLKNPMMLFLFLTISLFAKSQDTRTNPGTEIRMERMRADTEEKKEPVKDSSIVKLREEKKKYLTEDKRKAKAIYTGPTDTHQLVVLPPTSFLVISQKP
jgi:hypothetical protein